MISTITLPTNDLKEDKVIIIDEKIQQADELISVHEMQPQDYKDPIETDLESEEHPKAKSDFWS